MIQFPIVLYSKENSQKIKSDVTHGFFSQLETHLELKEETTLVVIHRQAPVFPDGVNIFFPSDNFLRNPDKNIVIENDFNLVQQSIKSWKDYSKLVYTLDNNELSQDLSVFIQQVKESFPHIKKAICVGVSIESSYAQYEYGSLLARALKSDSRPSVVIVLGESGFADIDLYKDYNEGFRELLKKENWQLLMEFNPFDSEEIGESSSYLNAFIMGLAEQRKNPSFSWKTWGENSKEFFGAYSL